MGELIGCTSAIPDEFLEVNPPVDIHRYLVDRAMLKIINDAHVVNWMPSLKKIYPIRTSGEERTRDGEVLILFWDSLYPGNGNCLLHAVLIAMIGTHDFDLRLRDLLVQYMEKHKEKLKAIWKTERIRTDKKYGIESEEVKLDSVSADSIPIVWTIYPVQ